MKYRCIGCNQIHDDNDIDRDEGDLEISDVPICCQCKKPMKFAIDKITKRLSKYLFEFDCDCHPKTLRLSRG